MFFYLESMNKMICEVIPVNLWDNIQIHDIKDNSIKVKDMNFGSFLETLGLSPYSLYVDFVVGMRERGLTLNFEYVAWRCHEKNLPTDVTILKSEPISKFQNVYTLNRPLSFSEEVSTGFTERAVS